jgi:hypothetical protein
MTIQTGQFNLCALCVFSAPRQWSGLRLNKTSSPGDKGANDLSEIPWTAPNGAWNNDTSPICYRRYSSRFAGQAIRRMMQLMV